jgi:hypothetical protein
MQKGNIEYFPHFWSVQSGAHILMIELHESALKIHISYLRRDSASGFLGKKVPNWLTVHSPCVSANDSYGTWGPAGYPASWPGGGDSNVAVSVSCSDVTVQLPMLPPKNFYIFFRPPLTTSSPATDSPSDMTKVHMQPFQVLYIISTILNLKK